MNEYVYALIVPKGSLKAYLSMPYASLDDAKATYMPLFEQNQYDHVQFLKLGVDVKNKTISSVGFSHHWRSLVETIEINKPAKPTKEMA